MAREISNENQIAKFLHCGMCLNEVKAIEGVSPAEYQNNEVGFTEQGIQVWCRRHDVNVMHMDFLGHKFPANTSRKPD